MTIRLTITRDGVVHETVDAVLKPFDQLSVADVIRICHTEDEVPAEIWPKNKPVYKRLMELARILDVPMRFVREMPVEEADKVLAMYREILASGNKTAKSINDVHATLADWAEAHEGTEWSVDDAREVLIQHGLYTDRVTVGDVTYTAPLVEPSDYGRWISLQAEMSVSKNEPESYVRSLAIMMDGPDGPYPVKKDDESDNAYQQRCDDYVVARVNFFNSARYVDVLSCATFFFSRSQRFAELTGHNMTLLNSWFSPKSKREPTVIPSTGDFMLS